MTGSDDGDLGHGGALTRALREFGVDLGDRGRLLEEALTPAPEEQHLPGLMDDLAERAEIGNAKRRGRGRPLGAVNLKNDQLFEAAARLGYKMPEVFLLELISVETTDLDWLRLQKTAADTLMQYRLARKPQAVEVSKQSLHVFMAGPMAKPEGKAELFNDINGGVRREPDNVSPDITDVH